MTRTTTKDATHLPSHDEIAHLRAFIAGNTLRVNRLWTMQADRETIALSDVFSGMDTRDAYLDWVRRYRVWINDLSATIRTTKALRRSACPEIRDSAQSRLVALSDIARTGNRFRRLAKIWSASRREARAPEVGA